MKEALICDLSDRDWDRIGGKDLQSSAPIEIEGPQGGSRISM